MDELHDQNWLLPEDVIKKSDLLNLVRRYKKKKKP